MTVFIMDADVQEMMAAARQCGQKIQYMCNEALRIYLPKRGFNIKRGKS